MPRAAQRAKQVDLEKYKPAAAPPASSSAQQVPPPATAIDRSPIMLASLPGYGSGPDAVIKQFNGGRSVPKSRILVP